MYDQLDYQKLIDKISRKYRRSKLNLSVINLETKTKTIIVQNTRNKLDIYKVIFDPKHTQNAMSYPDSYYCNSFEDLKAMLLFILKNPQIYVTKTKYDIMDLDSFCSLEDILDSEEIENYLD